MMRLCDAADSTLLVIDVQERLASAMPEESRDRVEQRTGRLLEAAQRLDIPVLSTAQYPKGLGSLLSSIETRLPEGQSPREKTCFSCAGAEGFMAELENTGRRQVVLCGMETHVCVLQTAFELRERGFDVFVVEDAACSRDPADHACALHRLRQVGIQVTRSESALFEWLRDARHPQFKPLSRLVR